MSKRIIGVAQELGISCRFHGNIPDGDTGHQLQACAVAPGRVRAKARVQTVVSPNEGDEVTRDERREVIVS